MASSIDLGSAVTRGVFVNPSDSCAVESGCALRSDGSLGLRTDQRRGRNLQPVGE